MARHFTFQLALLFNETVTDGVGNWQYAGANAVDQKTGQTAQLTATKRTNLFGGNGFPASILTATVIFPAAEGAVPPSMTLQGLHDLATNNETGSVISASAEHVAQIGGLFSFDAAAGVLTILPPGEHYARVPHDAAASSREHLLP
ncbi:MAG TPA: hypothetical protein VFN10_20670 [Thermoanaerobaculia bacterium]|nr:hypothetical protein [Thermoanaerobaculia bacterium]